MAKVDLVFRQVGERTSDIALDLAIRHIKPDNVHVMDDVRPFSECVNQMLRIRHDCDYVVYVDADCLILEDMRDFINQFDGAYVDTYVSDRFRGRLHCGVHITRADLVQAMAAVKIPDDDLPYVLRPESRLRGLAIRQEKLSKQFHNFNILHDYFQYYRHIFEKYALRELRSRAEEAPRLKMAMDRWPQRNGEIDDFVIARHAINYARRECPAERSADEVERFIRDLPIHAAQEMAKLGVVEKGQFTMDQLDEWRTKHDETSMFAAQAAKPMIFGVGLSRTGTRSLNSALQMLGFNTVHYPTDPITCREIANGQFDLTLLKHYDGITDITVAPYYAQLDKMYPNSKFILTVREKNGWLNSCKNHWRNSPFEEETDDPQRKARLELRRFFRASTYGCYEFAPERFAWVYDQHVKNVMQYFKDRPDKLLVINVCAGEGFEKLVPYLNRPEPCIPFPHKGAEVTRQADATQAKEDSLVRRQPEAEPDRTTIAA